MGRKRTYSLNLKAFDRITEQSAYWIGFLLADGFLPVKRGYLQGLTVALAYKDRCHLETLRAFLGSDCPIRTLHLKDSRPGWCDSKQAVLYVYSKHLAERLITLGVTPRKTVTAKPPEALLGNRHFWRGVVDGDGCLFFHKRPSRKRPQPILGLVGTNETVGAFASFISSKIDRARSVPHKRKAIYDVRYSANTAIDVATLLYKGSRIALPRKAKTAQQFMSTIPFRPYALAPTSRIR